MSPSTTSGTPVSHEAEGRSPLLFGADAGRESAGRGNDIRHILSVVLALVLGSLGAYAIARFRLRFRLERIVGLSLLTLRIVPAVVILIPVYLLMLQFRLLDTWLGLIITYTALNLTFCVWMMESFFREIPVDLPLDRAAYATLLAELQTS